MKIGVRTLQAAILGAAAMLYGFFARLYWVGYFNDDAYFIIGARALLRGRFVNLFDPYQRPIVHYLPGFPLFLAPFAEAAAPHWGRLKLLCILIALGSAAALARLFGRWLKPPQLAVLLALYALNPSLARAASFVMADMFFALLSLLVFLALRRCLEVPTPGGTMGLAALLGWSLIVRPTALPLAAAVAAGLLLARRRRTALLVCAGGFAVYALVALRNYGLIRAPNAYVPVWRSALARLASWPALLDNAQRVANLLFVAPFGLRLPYSPAGRAANLVLVAVLLAVCAAGMRDIARRGPKDRALAAAIALFLAGHFAVHASYPVIDARYALPALPYFLGFAAAGVFALAPRAAGAAAGAAGAALLLGNLAVGRAALAAAESPERRFPARTFAWVAGRTPPDAVLLSQRALPLSLYTGRRAVTESGADNEGLEAFHASLVRQGIGYFVDPPLRAVYLAGFSDAMNLAIHRRGQWAASSPRLFSPVFSDPLEGATIYEVLVAPPRS